MPVCPSCFQISTTRQIGGGSYTPSEVAISYTAHGARSPPSPSPAQPQHCCLRCFRTSVRGEEPLRIRSASKRRRRHTFAEVTSLLSDYEFKRAFRLSRSSFYKLLDLLGPLLERDEERAMRSSGGPVTPGVRLGVTLRLLAGGSYLDQMLTFRLGRRLYLRFLRKLWRP